MVKDSLFCWGFIGWDFRGFCDHSFFIISGPMMEAFGHYKDYFTTTFWFGDKAEAVVERSDLPGDIKNTLKSAKKYHIGRSLPISVRLPEDLEIVKKLIEIKINN